MSRPKPENLNKICFKCKDDFVVPDNKANRNRLYCSKTCSNVATAEKRAESTRALGKYQAPVCPCGKEVQPPPGQEYVYATQKKHCSPECRNKYSIKRQKDPTKWMTFNCLNCDKVVEARKNLNYHKYCSNTCAAKHTKVKKHFAVTDFEIVFDSGYEVLFWGILNFLKIPIERFDRKDSIEFDGKIYGPDFYLPTLDLYIEVKGLEDQDDRDRYEAWRVDHKLLVIDHTALEDIRSCSSKGLLLESLEFWAS